MLIICLLGMKMLKFFGGDLMRGCHVVIAQYQRTAPILVMEVDVIAMIVVIIMNHKS